MNLELGSLSPVDAAALAILLIAVLRGAWIGLIREGFSIAALTAAVFAIRFANTPAAEWLTRVTRGQIGQAAAPWLTGFVILVATVLAVAFVGRLLRRGAHFAGLGWADRLGGGALGAAEGALVAGIIVMGIVWVVGRDHPALGDSRSLEALDRVAAYVSEHADQLPDVAAPPSR
ncbi:MAG: CvpA family protein [Deltaproteobacteria bacterium]|nr:CvpA family protein [Deltaproteobacteria bacterium]MBW2419111.1 CvpA family protein [Deltaproteobacteria bacterium]